MINHHLKLIINKYRGSKMNAWARKRRMWTLNKKLLEIPTSLFIKRAILTHIMLQFDGGQGHDEHKHKVEKRNKQTCKRHMMSIWKTLVRLLPKRDHNPMEGHCFLACSGINFTRVSVGTPFNSEYKIMRILTRYNVKQEKENVGLVVFKNFIPRGLKLKSGGRKRPFGRRVFRSRSSSKKGWVKASNCIKIESISKVRPE